MEEYSGLFWILWLRVAVTSWVLFFVGGYVLASRDMRKAAKICFSILLVLILYFLLHEDTQKLLAKFAESSWVFDTKLILGVSVLLFVVSFVVIRYRKHSYGS